VVMILAGLALAISISEISKRNFKRNIVIAVIALIIFIGGGILMVNFF